MIRSSAVMNQIVYWMALILWIGVIITAGVAAMATFPTLRELAIQLPDYASYPAEDHWRIAGGQVLEKVFTFADLVQPVAATLLILCLLIELSWFQAPWRKPSTLVRIFAIAAATALLAFRMGTMAPDMNQNLRQFWVEAEQGNVEKAEEHRQAFDDMHSTASNIYGITLLLLLLTVFVSPIAVHHVQQAPRAQKPVRGPKLLTPES